MIRRSLALVVALSALLVISASAGAVNLPKNQSDFMSAQILDGRLVWFQRNHRFDNQKNRPPKVKEGVGALYARVLTAKKAEKVYLPPKGQKIVSFKTGGGRIVVGLATISESGRGPSQIVELTPGATTPWAAKPLAADPDTTDAATCQSRVELIAAQPDGDVLVQHDKLEGRGKDCVLARQVGQITAYAKDGTARQLAARKSGWANSQEWDLLPTLLPTANDWMLQVVSEDFDWNVPVSTWNAESGEYKPMNTDIDEVDRAEPLSGGGLVLRAWWYFHRVMPVPSNPVVSHSLWRIGYESWFHACGSQIVEFSRAWDRPNHGKWSIYLRNSSGKTTSKLDAKLAMGTVFDTCDQNTAVFHRARHDGGAHQWAVKLGG